MEHVLCINSIMVDGKIDITFASCIEKCDFKILEPSQYPDSLYFICNIMCSEWLIEFECEDNKVYIYRKKEGISFSLSLYLCVCVCVCYLHRIKEEPKAHH